MAEQTYPRYLSASQINIFLDCPLKYKLMYTGDIVKMPPNLYIIYGTAIHHVLETNYRQKITSRIDIPVKDAILEFNSFFVDQAHKELGYSINETILRTLMIQGEAMIIDYWEKIAPTVQPLLVEQKFEIQLETFPDVIIYGFIDLITEDGWIVDHKTCGESTAKNWNQKYVDQNLQLTLYYLWYQKTLKKKPAGVRIDALKRLKKGPEFEIIESDRTPVQILSLVHLMDKIKKMQQYDLIYPNYRHCDACEFSKTCTKLTIY